MSDDAFEWDKAKAADNYKSHGVTFEQATRAFADSFAVERLDDRENYGEVRFNILGMVDGRLLFVAFTLRGDTIRIISARGAEPHEKRKYHEDNT
jgi:uncharacterized DUF497 family protein